MSRKYKIIFWLVVVFLTVTIIATFIVRLYKLKIACTPEAFGTFGDYVGGVFGAFTGLISIVFLYFTYLKQIEIFREQKRDSEMRQFEQNFFQLLNNFRLTLSELQSKSGKTEGTNYMAYIRSLIEKDINEICYKSDALTDLNALDTRNDIDKIYQKMFIRNADKLGHYFRSLYHLLKYIEGHCHGEKKMYFDLVQAQMNTDELYLTCINGISSYGRRKLHPLLDNYSFLENLAIDDSEAIRNIVRFYYPKTKVKEISGIRKNVILVAGIKGTPKAELSMMLYREHLPIRITSLQAILIRQNLDPTDLIMHKDTLKFLLNKKLDPDDIYVICCDFCQLYKDGTNERIPLSLYEDLHVIALILLNPSFEELLNIIEADRMYNLDNTSAELYWENEECNAKDFVDMKDIPMYNYQCCELEKAVEKISNIVENLE